MCGNDHKVGKSGGDACDNMIEVGAVGKVIVHFRGFLGPFLRGTFV